MPLKQKPAAKAWVIDPIERSITPRHEKHIESLVSEIVDEDAEYFDLDLNVIWWCSNTDTNDRYAYYFERIGDPFSVRRYSKGLIISVGPKYWDEDAIKNGLRWYDRQNIWGDV
jgi:hypothetical protein